MLATLDTSLRATGAAIFDTSGRLVWADTIVDSSQDTGPQFWQSHGHRILSILRAQMTRLGLLDTSGQIVCELMDGMGRDADPRDLLEIQGLAGTIIGAAPYRLPGLRVDGRSARWKRSIPKKICADRVRARLTPEEISTIVDQTAKSHNAHDAIGLGLVVLQRWRV